MSPDAPHNRLAILRGEARAPSGHGT